MILEPHDYLSFLMGVAEVTDAELTNLGVTILERNGTAARGLLVPAASLPGCPDTSQVIPRTGT